LIIFSGGVVHAGALNPSGSGQPVAAESIDALACTASPVAWTDCSITLNRAIPAGGSIIASMNGAAGTVSYCSDGTPLNSFCAAYGNEAIFFCPAGCATGQQFDVSAIGTSPAALEHSLNVVLGPTDASWPGPGGIPRQDAGTAAQDTNATPPADAPAVSGSGAGDTAPAGSGGN
jgi:hypothetical protein